MRLRFPRPVVRPLAVVAGLVLVAPLAGAGPAGGADGEPAHPFDVFRNCPAAAMVADGHGDNACIAAEVTGGRFVIGKGTVPVTATSLLSLGQVTVDGEEVTYGVPGKVFETSPMQVPGGLLGVPGLERLLPGLTDITATVELATDEVPEVDVLNSNFGGHVVSLPIKIKLRNLLLGNKCYIGSDADPIVLNLSTGPTAPPPPNQPISGEPASFEFTQVSETASVVKAAGGSLVDNAFAVPKATGCGAGGVLNGVVNQRQGLPSPAGANTAILEQDAYLGGPASEVLAHQGG